MILYILAFLAATFIFLRFSTKFYRVRSKVHGINTVIVLGSGGHTAEMLHMFERSLNALNGKDLNEFLYHPRTYVVADTDKYSENKARHLEEKFGFKEYDDFSFSRIPRIREVGQSWLSTALSALRTLYPSLYTVWNSEPELIICNGPGTCVPICVAGLIFRYTGFIPKSCKILFIESFARVKTLSLSGRILYRLVDRFIVLWPELAEKYPRAKYAQGLLFG